VLTQHGTLFCGEALDARRKDKECRSTGDGMAPVNQLMLLGEGDVVFVESGVPGARGCMRLAWVGRKGGGGSQACCWFLAKRCLLCTTLLVGF